MKTNPRLRPLVVGALLNLLLAAPALAQITATPGRLDHLVCYRMKDKVQISSMLDLRAELQPEFTQAGCKIIRPFEFCVPATKMNVSPPPAQPGLAGQPLRNDYICYLIKCPKPVAPDRLVADQFGTRLQEKFKPFKVCVPARKAAPPCGPQSSARQCGGVCDDPTATCRWDRVAKECTCDPVPVCEGKPDAAGQCGGTCPIGQTCLPFLDGTKPMCRCQPPPDPPCTGTSAGACGGSCPNANERCILEPITNACICQPPEQGCAPAAGAQCAGTCTNPNLACSLDPITSECRCVPPPLPCGHNPLNGECGGACPTGQECRTFTTGTTVFCQCQ
jgi:hypothetical protein